MTDIPELKPDSAIIVRLDGKGLTRRFRTNELSNEELKTAMEYVVREIEKHCLIKFAYSTSDEVSLLIKNEYINEKEVRNRLEKLLTYLSGYVSSLFTISLYGNNSTTEKEAVSFDARAIIIEKNRIRKYFLCRQQFAIWQFIEKVCNHFGFKKQAYTIEQIDKELQNKGKKWDNYPRNIRYGFVGYYNESDQWKVEAAKDFLTEWDDYSVAIDRF